MRRIVVLVVLCVSASALACGDKLPWSPNSRGSIDTTVHLVLVVPQAATIKLGGTLLLAASIDAGPGVTDRSIVWSTSDAAVATVSQTGLVTPTGATGTIIISATSKADTSVKGKSTITVSN
jgi:hypothetical protein